MNEPMAALEAGVVVARAKTPEDARRIAVEDREVKRWQRRIQVARKFDDPVRQQYAKDRRYARGDSGYEVDANVVGTNIDILESFLYAKDPDFDVTPGPTVRPPSIESLREAVEEQLQQDPQFLAEVQRAGAQAVAVAVAAQVPGQSALEQIGPMAEAMKADELIDKQVMAMRKAFAVKRREVKNFAETCEIVGARMWKDGQLKRRGRPLVRSGLTIGIGIIKASWQERTEPSPVTVAKINDLQDNLAALRAAKVKAAEGGFFDKVIGAVRAWVQDDEETILTIQDQIRALQNEPQPVVQRGFVIDNLAGEDFQIPPGFTMSNHLDAPWNAHRFWVLKEDAQAQYGLTDEEVAQCVKFRARRPQMVRNVTISTEATPISPKEADQFINAGSDDAGDWGLEPEEFQSDAVTPAPDNWLEGWEIWDRDANCVRTMITGLCRWAAPSWIPKPTTRFYPFFLLPISDVDGQRHPQSLTTRSAKLVDEYNRIGSAEAEHRRRIIPKTGFNAGMIDSENVAKIEKGGIQEMVALKLTDPTAKVSDVLYPISYAAIDPALYNRGPIIQEINRIWGTQEALGGAINVDKTATEADIAQQGFQARSGSKRDQLDMLFNDLAEYTIETARAFVSTEDAQALAGPDAFWPPYEGAEDMVKMLLINVRAGSSGKPNTALERQSWATLLPMLQSSITQIAQLRGATPDAMADAMEQLLRITAERSGERIDIDQLIPQKGEAPAQPQVPPPGGPQPGNPAPPNTAAPTPDPAADATIDPTNP